MAVKNPAKVPKKKITSFDITGFSGGLFLNGAQNASENQFIESRDVELTNEGLLTPRRSVQTWLPNTVETVYDVFPAIIDSISGYGDNGKVHNFVADDGKIKFCLDGATAWTDCAGANTITTNNGGKCKFIRTLDSILILNGGNGDKLAYVDLTDSSFPVVKYSPVADPTTAPTAATTGVTGTNVTIYYGYTYSSATGETKISNILSHKVSKPRSTWADDGSEYVTVTRPAGIPTNATYWNLYIALAASGGTVQDSDMLMLASGLDLNDTQFVDNGSLAIDIGRGNPPTVNTSDGPRVKHGMETDGRPILWGDVDNPHNIWIGGDGEFARDFSSANGGYRTEPSKGTNYYPASVFGYRNGQGIPSLTILFSNTEGLSKQATLEQQTITYGNQSFVVWGVTEQHYGAAGVASALGVVNYKGQASFPSTDGFTAMDTKPQLQNVISTERIDKNIKSYTRRIKVEALNEIVGTAWDDKVHWLVPASGFDTPNEILIRDLNNNGAWYRLAIAAQWTGVVSPKDQPAFIYLCQGNRILKFFNSLGTVDYLEDGAHTFSTMAKSGLIGLNDAHNQYQAVVQAVFYALDIVGTVTVGVTYRNQNGKLKTKRKTHIGPEYSLSTTGNWSDPQYTFNQDSPAGWDESVELTSSATLLEGEDKRIVVPINDLVSEVQWFIETDAGYNDYKLKSVSFEGENLGVKPDLV